MSRLQCQQGLQCEELGISHLPLPNTIGFLFFGKALKEDGFVRGISALQSLLFSCLRHILWNPAFSGGWLGGPIALGGEIEISLSDCKLLTQKILL
jgi:hypothetical protein